MSDFLGDFYDAKAVEQRFYEIWERRGYFEIDGNAALQKRAGAGKRFAIMMPPPNVTGVLHIGHALTFTLQDIIVRYKRMDGYRVLWQPGLDHAGIATQNIVEKRLLAQGRTKESLGREAFLSEVWKWRESSGGTINAQLRRLGASPAWSRERFTMDDGLKNAVKAAFVSLYDKGLIYRGNYMVNWCTHDGALSDVEVEHAANKGKLYYLRYYFADGRDVLGRECGENSSNSNLNANNNNESAGADSSNSNLGENGGKSGDKTAPNSNLTAAAATNSAQNPAQNATDPATDQAQNATAAATTPAANLIGKPYIIVATTRPETYFGDTAVMVNPADPRYAAAIGRKVILPFINREVEIIADDHVDAAFGTGAVKVTPAHDTNDYEVGKRHALQFITIFDEKGILNEHCGRFAGLERLAARDVIADALAAEGFVEKIEDYENQVGYCYRCKNVVEPYISRQWFVSPKVADKAVADVAAGGARFFPPHWINSFNAWMRDLQPWCISRQLWWGHRIPVFYCACGHEWASADDAPSACPRCGGGDLRQDPDVLDTWFSSGLWPISTLGWGNGNALRGQKWQDGDLAEFYPNSLLITGFDILFFWVARMMFQCENATGQLPFSQIYLHALVKDKDGKKMSKSSGNVIDPLVKIDEFSADILRFCLTILCVAGRDIRMSDEPLILARNFINKLYNAMKFLLANSNLDGASGEKSAGADGARSADGAGAASADGAKNPASPAPFGDLVRSEIKSELGRWMLARFDVCAASVRENLDAYRFNDAAAAVQRFLWDEFCDWGLELLKAQKSSVRELGAIFREAMKLLAPFMPFFAEFAWQALAGRDLGDDDAESVMVSAFPPAVAADGAALREFALVQEAVVSLRRAKAAVELGNARIERAFVRFFDGAAGDLGADLGAASGENGGENASKNLGKNAGKNLGENPATTAPNSNLNAFDFARVKKFIERLAKTGEVVLVAAAPAKCVRDIAQNLESFVSLENIDTGAILARLNAQKIKVEKELSKLAAMLANAKFVQNAPAKVLDETRAAHENAAARLAKINDELGKFA